LNFYIVYISIKIEPSNERRNNIVKVKRKQIDKNVRMKAYLSSLIIRPSVRSFKTLQKISERFIGNNIEGMFNDQIAIKSLNKGPDIRTRIIRPLNCDKKLPGVLYLHGGGYAFGEPEQDYSYIEELMKVRDCVVVAPSYRNSLKEPFPAAFNDAWDTLMYMKEHAHELGIRSDQLIVYGTSAGGGLAAALCLRARDTHKVNIAFQMPLYAMLDSTLSTQSMKDNNAPIWNEKLSVSAWGLYLKGIEKNSVSKYASPYLETNYSGLPPAFSFTGEFDPFKDENQTYMDRLEKAGVPAKFKIFKGGCHGFEVFTKKGEIAQQAIKFTHECFAYGIDNYFNSQD